MRTFLERDLPQLGSNVPAEASRRFWTMLAHYHGQAWNAADPARSLGVSEPAVRRNLDLLTSQERRLMGRLCRRRNAQGVEIKRADAPVVMPSMRIALRDLKLEYLTVLYPGSRRYALGERITVVPVAAVAEGPDGIFPRRKAAPAKRRRG